MALEGYCVLERADGDSCSKFEPSSIASEAFCCFSFGSFFFFFFPPPVWLMIFYWCAYESHPVSVRVSFHSYAWSPLSLLWLFSKETDPTNLTTWSPSCLLLLLLAISVSAALSLFFLLLPPPPPEILYSRVHRLFIGPRLIYTGQRTFWYSCCAVRPRTRSSLAGPETSLIVYRGGEEQRSIDPKEVTTQHIFTFYDRSDASCVHDTRFE